MLRRSLVTLAVALSVVSLPAYAAQTEGVDAARFALGL